MPRAVLTRIDPWFLYNLQELVAEGHAIAQAGLAALDREKLLRAKQDGFSDQQLARLTGTAADDVRKRRIESRNTYCYG